METQILPRAIVSSHLNIANPTVPTDLSSPTSQPLQPEWSPAASKGFAAGIVLMIGIPIFTVFAIVARRRLQGYYNSEALENEHWERTLTPQVQRLPTQRDPASSKAGPVRR
jgi:hypothetical protein